MRGSLARALRHFGYQVMEATGAMEAQRLAGQKRQIRLLFLNLSAPRNDLELAVWFHATHPETKVVVATDCLWDVNHHTGGAPEISYLAKPYTSRELGGFLRRVLA